MEIKFTTSSTCMGEYSEVILREGTVNKPGGMKRLAFFARQEFQHWRKQSSNFPLLRMVQMSDGTWESLFSWMDDLIVFDIPNITTPGAIEKFNDELAEWITSLPSMSEIRQEIASQSPANRQPIASQC